MYVCVKSLLFESINTVLLLALLERLTGSIAFKLDVFSCENETLNTLVKINNVTLIKI